MNEKIGFEVQVAVPYEQAVELVTQALKTEGFGVLTSIDVKATLKEKLDQEFRPYAILGACNPPLAHRALSSDPNAGLMLPCNVTVEAQSDQGALVRILDPRIILSVGSLASNPELQAVAQEAYVRLERVAQKLAS